MSAGYREVFHEAAPEANFCPLTGSVGKKLLGSGGETRAFRDAARLPLRGYDRGSCRGYRLRPVALRPRLSAGLPLIST